MQHSTANPAFFWKPVLIYAPSSSAAVCDASAERKCFQGGAAQ